MTLLSICQAVADEVKLTRPSTVAANSQPEVQQLYRLANRVGKSLMKKVAWQALRKEKTFTALGQETQTSILPSDFDRFVPETFWNRTERSLWIGPITAVEWQGLKATNYQGAERKFIYRGDGVLVIPSPTAGDSLAFEYVSNQWAQSSGGTAQTSFSADSDTAVIDEELIIRGLKFVYLTDEGLPNGAAAADFNDYFDDVVGNDQPSAGVMTAADIFTSSGSRQFGGAPIANGTEAFI